MKQLFFVYILQSKKDESFYVGQCEDLDARVCKHNDGWSKYSSPKRPWRLLYFETFPTRSTAIQREKQIKAKKSRIYLQHLVDQKLALYTTSG